MCMKAVLFCISAGCASPRYPFGTEKRICARDMAIAPESNGPDANNSLQDVHHRSVYMFAVSASVSS
jgi:hypothetical protein